MRFTTKKHFFRARCLPLLRSESNTSRVYNIHCISKVSTIHCKLFSVGSQEEPDLEIQAFKICDTNEDDALTWQEVEDCEVCKY